MRYWLLVIGILFFVAGTHAQSGYNHNWMFGQHCWLQYNPNDEQWHYQLGSSLQSEEACVSISDSAGNLLFYSDGSRVFNREHEIMPNGDSIGVGLLIQGPTDTVANTYSSGVTAFPIPSEQDKYYLFYKNDYNVNYLDSNLSYSIIDVTLNSGFGDVIVKNKKLFSGGQLSERVLAVKHANGRDWWLMSDFWSDSLMFQYLITPQGIQGPYTYPLIGGFWLDGYSAGGQIVSSADGSMLAANSIPDDVWTCDFDRCTGAISNQHAYFVNAQEDPYGLSVSPDKTKLYLSMMNEHILQLCLDTSQSTVVSIDTLWENPWPNYALSFYPGQMQYGPDGSTYTTVPYYNYDSTSSGGSIKYLYKVTYPDSCGDACGFVPQAVYVGPGYPHARLGLPNIPNFDLGPLVGSDCDTLHTSNNSLPSRFQSFIIFPNPARGSFSVSFTKSFSNLRLCITDVLGRIVYSNIYENPAKSINVLTDLPSGFYFVEIKDEKGFYAVNKLSVLSEK